MAKKAIAVADSRGSGKRPRDDASGVAAIA